jgi:hypothetical protein
MYAIPMITTLHRMRRTPADKQMPVRLDGAAHAVRAAAVVKCHGDKLGEAFK